MQATAVSSVRSAQCLARQFKKRVPMAQALNAAEVNDMNERSFDLIVLGVGMAAVNAANKCAAAGWSAVAGRAFVVAAARRQQVTAARSRRPGRAARLRRGLWIRRHRR